MLSALGSLGNVAGGGGGLSTSSSATATQGDFAAGGLEGSGDIISTGSGLRGFVNNFAARGASASFSADTRQATGSGTDRMGALSSMEPMTLLVIGAIAIICIKLLKG